MPEGRQCVSYTLVQSNDCWCAVRFIATAKVSVTTSYDKLENGTGNGHCLLTVLSVTQRQCVSISKRQVRTLCQCTVEYWAVCNCVPCHVRYIHCV